MHLINRSKSLVAFLLASIVVILCALPMAAAEEAAKSIEIRIKVGSNQMLINGTAVKIQPPYQAAGTTMVPLSLLTNTNGFGMKLQLKDNKIITLTDQKHTIILTQGSKAGTINGKKVELAVAPIVKQGVTMVPLKPLIQAIGAKLSVDAKTKELVINATVVSSNVTGNKGASIDPDAGKSQIGDSHYQWSMNYPTGLVQEYQSDNGEWISFTDVKDIYYLAVSVEEATDTLDTTDKRDRLFGYISEEETIVDTRTLNLPAGTFEKIVTKSKEGFFYEYRGIQANGYFYTIIYGKKAKSASELSANVALLDSFKPSFSRTNKSLKDLARIKNGKIAFEHADYGLKVQLPKNWAADKKSGFPYYIGPNGSYLSMIINSIADGDTLDQWVERRLKLYEDIKNEIYYSTPRVSTITWNGVPATLVKSSHSPDTVTWFEEYEIFAFNGQYKYYVDVAFERGHQEDEAMVVEQMLNGMTVDFSHNEKTFGLIPDSYEVDLTSLVTKTNKKFGYSLTLPKYWTRGVTDLDSEDLEFAGMGMALLVSVDTEVSGMSESIAYFEEEYIDDNDLVLDSKTSVNYAGESAIKYTLTSTKSSDEQSHTTIYFMEKNGDVYIIIGVISDAYSSELNLKQLEDALNSFQFTK